jgi:very-short-patch-repair endonuclease
MRSSKTDYLKAQGIDVARFWNNEALLDIESVLFKLELRVTPLHPP